MKNISLDRNSINPKTNEAQKWLEELKNRTALVNEGINEIKDDIPKIKNLISKLNGQNMDMMKSAKIELKSFTELEKAMEIEFHKGCNEIKKIKGWDAKIALHNYNQLFKKFTETVKKSFLEVTRIVNMTSRVGEVYQLLSDTYYNDINNELKELELKLMDFEDLEDFQEMHENLRGFDNPTKNIHDITKEKCKDFEEMNKNFIDKQKISNSKIKINEINCKNFLNEMIKMRQKIYDKFNLENKREGKELINLGKNEINESISKLIKDFEKESGKISSDGNYIENLYAVKPGFEKKTENNTKDLLKSIKEEEKNKRNISEKVNISQKFAIDIQILMDITGSMTSYLSEAQMFLKSLVNNLIHSSIGLTLRFSFIGYRDINEEFVNIDFTEKHEYITSSISNCIASGGGDECEDVAGALEKGIKKNWNSKARYVILVCDAPAHGTQYHNFASDNYPGGDPNGRNIEQLVNEFYNLDLNFFCVKLNESTNIMFNCFKNIYMKRNNTRKDGLYFRIKSLSNSSQLKDFIIDTAKMVYSTSRYGKPNKEKYIDEEWGKIESSKNELDLNILIYV